MLNFRLKIHDSTLQTGEAAARPKQLFLHLHVFDLYISSPLLHFVFSTVMLLALLNPALSSNFCRLDLHCR